MKKHAQSILSPHQFQLTPTATHTRIHHIVEQKKIKVKQKKNLRKSVREITLCILTAVRAPYTFPNGKSKISFA